MADNTNDGLSRDLWQQSSLKPAETYNIQFRDTFYALVPTNLRPYFMYVVRRCLNWYQGFVPECHTIETGMFSTSNGNAIVKQIARLCMGGHLYAQNELDEANGDQTPNPSLKQWQEWSESNRFQIVIASLLEYAAAGGTAYLRTGVVNGELQVSAVRIDQCFSDVDFAGRIVDFTYFLKSYSAKVSEPKKGENNDYYYLLERRYYNDKGDPVIKIIVKRDFGQTTTQQNFSVSEAREVSWDQISKSVQDKIRAEYGKIRIGEEMTLPFKQKNLGIFKADFTAVNRTPEIRLGESVLLNVLTYLWGFDFSVSSRYTDEYIGRGRVILPKQMTNPSAKNNAMGYYDGSFEGLSYARIPMINADQQKPISVQFDLRMAEHNLARNILAEDVAAAVGVSGSDLYPYLRDATGSKTATEIENESKITDAFIKDKRELIGSTIAQFVNFWRTFYGIKDRIKICFPDTNENKLVMVEVVRAMKESGASLFDIFKRMNPTMDEYQVKQMVTRALKEKEEDLRLRADITAESNMMAFEQRMRSSPDEKKLIDEKPGDRKGKSSFSIFKNRQPKPNEKE